MKKAVRLVLMLAVVLSACNMPNQPTAESAPSAAAPVPGSASEPPAAAPASDNSGAGDIIFHNGHILTMDPDRPTTQAILVNGETVRAVGSSDEILALRGGGTEVIDLGGLTLMPGFVDAHSHMFGDDLLNGRDPAPNQQMAIQYGVTTMTEMGMDQTLFDKLQSYAETGALRLRLNAYLGYTTNCGDLMGDWWKTHKPNDLIAPNLHVRGLKIFTDGGSCKIPAVSVPYPGGSMGDLFFTQEQLNAIVAEAQGAGFQVAIHALGDRAVEQAQNAIAAALNGSPNTLRHRIEHNAVIRPDMMARYSEVGIVPVIFGAYATCVRTADTGRYKYILPEAYVPWEWPWRGLLDANPGLPIAWHADYGPLDYLNPFYVLWGFVTRNEVNSDGSMCAAPEPLKLGAIRVDEALPMMTINSAYALFMENEVGSLEPGKLADLVILSENPLTAPTDSLKDIAVLMTMIGGKVEYCASGRKSMCPIGAPSGTSPAIASAAPAPVTASAELPESPAANARDGDLETIWNSGSGPEQWIMLNLAQPQSVSLIRLTVSQFPEGETTHQIWLGSDPGSLTMIREFRGLTTDGDVLTYFPLSPLTGVQYIQVVTKRSTSWVAWREIEIQ